MREWGTLLKYSRIFQMILLKALKNKVLERIALQRSESLYLEIATENLELRAHFLYTYVIFIKFFKELERKKFFQISS